MNAFRTAGGPAGVIWVDDDGDGDVPVVFAHSFAGSHGHWSEQLRHLRPERRAVAFDFRGHGHSSLPTGHDYSVDALASDIRAVADELDLRRMVLVGHSMGGSAAIAFAGAEPDRIAALVLVGTPGRTPSEQARDVMATIEANYDEVMAGYWNKLLDGARPEVRERISQEIGSVSKNAALAIIDALFEFDPMPALRRFDGPILLVTTAHVDAPGTLPYLLPDAPNTVITGTSHWVHMDKPDQFNALLDRCLAQLECQVTRPAIASRSA
jgi:pimeloyl-ACP methyl ester carboxylesterase